jgi:hypothetical protein
MKTISISTFSIFLISAAFTSSFASEKMRSHGAHVHGEAKLALAFENPNLGEGDLDVPAEAIIGFEHAAKTPAQKKQEADGLALLRKTISQFWAIPPAIGCEIFDVKAEREPGDGKHSDIEASFKIKCEQPIFGIKAKTQIFKTFPKIKKLTVSLVLPKSASEQKLSPEKTELEFSGK